MSKSDSEVRKSVLAFFANTAAARVKIDRYYHSERFTGADFEKITDRSTPDFITARDIVAVQTLSVTVPAETAIWLLIGSGKDHVHDLLRQIPTVLDLWNAGPAEIGPKSPLWRLWDLLHAQNNVGNAITAKLLHAKRPRLVPLQDSRVDPIFDSDDIWGALAHTLALPSDRAKIESATCNAPVGLSLLRRMDVVLWMRP